MEKIFMNKINYRTKCEVKESIQVEEPHRHIFGELRGD
jgi:hypothetical protein